ncbi:MAG: stage V sporulation protein S [Anaerolineae bacterium]
MADMIIKVSRDSQVTRVAGAIAHAWRAGQKPVARAIGAGAVSQAIKSVAVASRYLGVHLACVPGLEVVQVDGRKRTVVTLSVLALDEKGDS